MSQRDVIAIGGSLGALDAARALCARLPAGFPASVFIVVHLGSGSRDLVAGIIGRDAAIPVTTAADGETVERGHVYVAAAERHLLVIDDVIRLGHGPRENMARPAIDPLFRSVAVSYGPRVVALVLSGLLNDGAAGLVAVKRCGGIAVVQNPSDSAASQMPLAALRTGDVDYRAPIAELGELLVKLTGQPAGRAPAIPSELAVEVEIALGRPLKSDTVSRLANPVPLSCPDCGGVLSQLKAGPPLRFRCQVGHGFTAEALAAKQEHAVDEAVRVALRIITERVSLIEKMAEEARRSGRSFAASSFEKASKDYRAQVETLQRAIARTGSG